jgi:Protein of unknown function (DUF3426)
MYIQCPNCRTINEVENHADVGNDMVNCNHCEAIIHTPQLLDDTSSISMRPPTTIPAPKGAPPEDRLLADTEIMNFNDNYQLPGGSGYPSAWWIIAILALLLIFVLQYSYFMRNELAQHTVLRPWLERLCILAACDIPMQKDINKIIILNREIHGDTDNKNILQVNITLKNIATYIQPFPKIQLTFSDINGNKIAYRQFSPDEYLSKQLVKTRGMQPQVPVLANLQILDPGRKAVTFEFEFF